YPVFRQGLLHHAANQLVSVFGMVHWLAVDAIRQTQVKDARALGDDAATGLTHAAGPAFLRIPLARGRKSGMVLITAGHGESLFAYPDAGGRPLLSRYRDQ